MCHCNLREVCQTVRDQSRRLSSLIESVVPDGDQRELCSVNGASPEGKEVQVTSHQSGNDLWPFGIAQTSIASDLAWFT